MRRVAVLIMAVVAVLVVGLATAGVASAAPRRPWVPNPHPTQPPAAVACPYPTLSFHATTYCPVALTAIGAYGENSRVVLPDVTVDRITADSVTVARWEQLPCPTGSICGASFVLREATVTWSGSGRPAYGDVINLFGIAIGSTLRPHSYGWITNCPIDVC